MKKLYKIIIAVSLVVVFGLSFIGSPTISYFNFIANGGDEGLATAPVEHSCIWECPECGLCLDPDCQEEVCKDKCQGHEKPHECESKCADCGKCLDLDCKADACKNKCGDGENMTAYTFEAEDSHVKLTAGTSGTNNRALNVHKNGYVGQFDGTNAGATITFTINSPKATKATLLISISKRVDSRAFNKYLQATINGIVLETPAILPASSDGTEAWESFATVALGCVQLKAGENVIKFAVVSSHTTAGGNFDKIIIKSSEQLTWPPNAAHVCESVCPICGKCQDSSCVESACVNKCEHLASYTFEAEHDNVIVVSSAGVTKRHEKGCIGGISTANGVLGDTTITFNITADEATTSNFIIYINKRMAAYEFSSVYKVTVNGTVLNINLTVPSNGTAEGWGTYHAFSLGEISFVKGNNVIVIETVKNSSTAVGSDIDKICFETTAGLSWTTN